MRFRIKAGRAKADPEKLVTPGILYASKSEDGTSVHLIAIGWWDWHLSFLCARVRRDRGSKPVRAETGTGSVHESPGAEGNRPPSSAQPSPEPTP